MEDSIGTQDTLHLLIFGESVRISTILSDKPIQFDNGILNHMGFVTPIAAGFLSTFPKDALGLIQLDALARALYLELLKADDVDISKVDLSKEPLPFLFYTGDALLQKIGYLSQRFATSGDSRIREIVMWVDGIVRAATWMNEVHKRQISLYSSPEEKEWNSFTEEYLSFKEGIGRFVSEQSLSAASLRPALDKLGSQKMPQTVGVAREKVLAEDRVSLLFSKYIRPENNDTPLFPMYESQIGLFHNAFTPFSLSLSLLVKRVNNDMQGAVMRYYQKTSLWNNAAKLRKEILNRSNLITSARDGEDTLEKVLSEISTIKEEMEKSAGTFYENSKSLLSFTKKLSTIESFWTLTEKEQKRFLFSALKDAFMKNSRLAPRIKDDFFATIRLKIYVGKLVPLMETVFRNYVSAKRSREAKGKQNVGDNTIPYISSNITSTKGRK